MSGAEFSLEPVVKREEDRPNALVGAVAGRPGRGFLACRREGRCHVCSGAGSGQQWLARHEEDGSDRSTAGTDRRKKPSRPRTRREACDKLADYVGNYDYIEEGTSVRVFNILMLMLQGNCPTEARAQGFDGNAGEPSCLEPYDDRFTCQAFDDPNFPASPISTIIATYEGN